MAASSIAMAQQADPTSVPRFLVPIFLAGMIAYLTRRLAIGGWLFYFYIGLLLGPMFALVLAYPDIGGYLQPSRWQDLKTYLLSFFSYVPWLVCQLVVFLCAVRLIFKSQRNRANAMLLRYALLALAASGALAWIIEINYFPGYALFSAISAVWAGFVCLYFFTSKRVRSVFDNWSGSWSYDNFVDSYSSKKKSD